jgi:flagellar biosynthesis protein
MTRDTASDQKPPHNPLPSAPKTIAVAVEESAGAAPKVSATGRGYVAEQILQIAFARGIKVREDADLVQVLAALDVESDIPTEAFAAVAEILAYVYRANGQVPPEMIAPIPQERAHPQ